MTKIERHKKLQEIANEFRELCAELQWSKTDRLEFDAILERQLRRSMKQVRAEAEQELTNKLQ